MKKSNIFLLVVILVILLLGVGLVLINNTNNHNNNNNLTGNVISINNPEILNPNNNSINSLLGTFWTTYPGSSQNDIARFKAIGGSWVKPIFYWRAYETTKDHYNVTYLKQFDAVISANQNAGLENTIVIDGGNVPGWQDCINYKHYLCDNCRKDPIYGGNCTDQEFNGAVEQFSKLAQEVVKHYSVSPYNITTFQIMIEPNTGEKYKVDFVYPEKFAEIIANVYPKIKEICNGARNRINGTRF